MFIKTFKCKYRQKKIILSPPSSLVKRVKNINNLFKVLIIKFIILTNFYRQSAMKDHNVAPFISHSEFHEEIKIFSINNTPGVDYLRDTCIVFEALGTSIGSFTVAN